MKYSFEATHEEVAASPEAFIEPIFSSLVSDFMVMPKGEGFLEYATFSVGYEALKKATAGLTSIQAETVLEASKRTPVILIVLRTILGITPPEWAYLASVHCSMEIPQGAARSLDRAIRLAPFQPLRQSSLLSQRVRALVNVACSLIENETPVVGENQIHRLTKADSLQGLLSVRQLSDMGVPYAMLLYERLLGRPFAGHRDSVSELVGDGLENKIEEVLQKAGVSFRKTRRAERLKGFEQAPDFIIPDEHNPEVVIEAKVTEDDGTARDKITRVIRLCQQSAFAQPNLKHGFEVIACISGRGFAIRREDMRQAILHTKGKIFTPQTLSRMVDCSRLSKFKTRT